MQLLGEIRIHRSIKHKHIVGFLSFFEDKVNVYIMLELCSNNVSGPAEGEHVGTLRQRSTQQPEGAGGHCCSREGCNPLYPLALTACTL